ncbi:uncharacterized protein TNCV_5064921 [Trichonephila clavipes]|nr:uncharacterized protein TNCV_5064921 [Trichonephila clavipes]
MWTPQLKVQGLFWLTEFKSVKRVQRRVRTERNVDPPSLKSIHQWEITFKETGTLVSQTATRGLLATDHVILNHGQVTWTTPELAPPLLTTTPHQREDVSALDRFNVHRCPIRGL